MDSAGRTRLIAAALTLVVVGCGGPQKVAIDDTQRPLRPGLALVGRADSSTGGNPSGDRSSGQGSSKGDLKTFAFASTDGAAITAEVTSVLAPAGGGGTVRYEGYELLDDAARLESMANAAKQRLRGVHPSDRTLMSARGDGIAAYSLTADVAELMVNLARADAGDDLGALNTAANQALALEGRGEELAALYTALISELEAWSRSHPHASGEALKRYGG